MDKQYFIELLQKHQQGAITNEERQFLECYYNLFNEEPDVLAMLPAGEKKKLQDEIRQGMLKDMSAQNHATKVVWYKRNLFLKISVSAAALIIVFTGLFYTYNASSKKELAQQPVVHNQTNKNNQLETPAGEPENRMIFLPDGSKVVLSAGSKLNYPSSFDGMPKREVFLDGQAFFDIKHNPSRPFIVHTGNVKTVVLGTAFNVKAISGEKDIVVTVKRGKVKVSDDKRVLGVITPNQQIAYDKQHIASVLTNIKDENYLEWQQRDMIIDNLTMSEAARLMEEKYGVKIIISDPEVESLRFTTTFGKDATLEQMLSSICVFNALQYDYDKKKTTLTITRK
ncbi:MAG: FecR family protein [Agriterribacter sp.]